MSKLLAVAVGIMTLIYMCYKIESTILDNKIKKRKLKDSENE